MVDLSLFPSAGELAKQVDDTLFEALDSLPRPLKWDEVEKRLFNVVEEYWIHPTFEDEFYNSGEVGDYMIHARGKNGALSHMGYRTYPDGAEMI